MPGFILDRSAPRTQHAPVTQFSPGAQSRTNPTPLPPQRKSADSFDAGSRDVKGKPQIDSQGGPQYLELHRMLGEFTTLLLASAKEGVTSSDYRWSDLVLRLFDRNAPPNHQSTGVTAPPNHQSGNPAAPPSQRSADPRNQRSAEPAPPPTQRSADSGHQRSLAPPSQRSAEPRNQRSVNPRDQRSANPYPRSELGAARSRDDLLRLPSLPKPKK